MKILFYVRVVFTHWVRHQLFWQLKCTHLFIKYLVVEQFFFNHEFPRRPEEYVTKKIIKAACDIYAGKKNFIELGDIKIRIDWGYAKDYVEVAWKIMQLKKPDFFVIATGKTNSVEAFAKKAFDYLDLDFYKYLKINKKLIRPAINQTLVGDTSKAFKTFNYKPKTNIDQLIKIMIESELSKNEL